VSKKPRKVIIGIDGVPFSLIDQLSNQGVMPFFNYLKREGSFKVMKSSVPAVSSVSWSSIITGHNPGQHGIFGFTSLIPNTYALSFPNFLSLKKPAFWQKKDTGTKVIVNTPTTYPAQPLKGCHVSGFVAPTLEKAVYPKSELATLEKIDYQIDLDVQKAKLSELLLYKQLYEAHEKREELAQYLWDKYDPDLFMLVITGSDRIGHFAWDHYEDKQHLSNHKFLEYFRRVDQTIKNFAQKLNSSDKLVILSDHGMERAKQDVNLNAYLIKYGFLVLDDNRRNKYNRIKSETKAFALEDGRIYLNKKGKYPKGSVLKDQEAEIISNLTSLFGKIEITEKKVVDNIYQVKDIYQGNQVSEASDLIITAKPGFKLTGQLTSNFYRPSQLPGMHNDQAFLLIKSPDCEELMPLNPTIEDIVNIIN